ncbi:MAG TPA: hypothetical protein VFG59_18220 [Anaeromyxobacter sp.]|nr:hypothetical protein [Anaeromyxobacter sp.]
MSVRGIVVWAVLVLGSLARAAEPPRPRIQIRFGGEVGRPGETVTIEATYLDESGDPVDAPASLGIDSDAGTVSPPERVRTGVYRATLVVPRTLPVSRSVLVLAHAGAVSTGASMQLGPGPAARMHVDGPATCSEDREACRIEVSAEDANGNMAEELPSATSRLGRISPPSSVQAGRWVIAYHAPRVERPVEEQILVELGALREEHRLRILPTRTRIGLAPMAGLAELNDRAGFVGGGQLLGERLFASGWIMGAGLEGSAWIVTKSTDVSGLRVHQDRRLVGAQVFFLAERRVVGSLVGTLSVGAGLARITTSQWVEDQPKITDSGWAPSASGAAALGYRFRFMQPFVELRAAWVGSRLATDNKSWWPVFVQLGYRFDVH